MPNEIEPLKSGYAAVAKIGSGGLGRKNITEMTSYTSGSAIIYKGEPTATELGMLRFKLTTEDLAQVNVIVAGIMKRHENLEKSGEEAVRSHVDAVVERMKQDNLAVPFTIDFSPPEDRYSTEAKPQDSSDRWAKFARLFRRFDPRRTGGDHS